MGYQFPLYVRKLSTPWSAKSAWCGLHDERRAGSPAEKWGQSVSAIVVPDPAASQTRGTVGVVGAGCTPHSVRASVVRHMADGRSRHAVSKYLNAMLTDTDAVQLATDRGRKGMPGAVRSETATGTGSYDDLAQ